MRKIIAFLVVAAMAIVLAPGSASARVTTLTGLYNKRYCEIFTVSPANPTGLPEAPPGPGTSPGFTVDIFNTVGLNNCPATKWANLDFDAVKTETGSIAAVPNGPRRWLIDTIAGGKAGKPLTLAGLPVRHVAVLKINTLQPLPYTEMKIARTTTWVFKRGRKIHFLISPEGRRYALQAYTVTLDHSLRARNLNRLGRNPKMELPEGWTYRTIKLKKQLRLRAPGMATILRDPVGGTYQRFRWPKNFFKTPLPPQRHRAHRTT